MSELKAPSISVVFTELGASAVKRGQKGVVALILRDAAEVEPFVLTSPEKVPATLGRDNQDYVKRTFIGYVDPPKKVIAYVAKTGEDEDLADALAYMATQDFDYLCGPAACTANEASAIAAWIKAQRATAPVKYKAVLPDQAADSCAVVDFTAQGMTDGTNTYTTAAYCSRIAGLLAGTPMRMAATYAPLGELSDVGRLTREEQDAAVAAGKLILIWDGRKVKLSRAVTSLTTTTDTMGDSSKKIKLVEIMDMIRTDIISTAEDGYIGKYANSYDNKLLLVTAIRGYFQGLERDGLVQAGYTVDIDVDAQTAYLTSIGIDVSEMSDQEIREANTGTHVFIVIRCKLLDAIEDIAIYVEI